MEKQIYLKHTAQAKKKLIEEYSKKIIEQSLYLQKSLNDCLSVTEKENMDDYAKAYLLRNTIISSSSWITTYYEDLVKNVELHKLLTDCIEEE